MRFCETIGQRSITEFNYRFNSGSEHANIFVGVALSEGSKERQQLLVELQAGGYKVVDMTDNEMAKLHVRYMVGGHATGISNERLLRFEFPERRGALLKFLKAIGTHWNISLFHYRNHGSDYGRVLAGVQVPAEQLEDLRLHLHELKYPYQDETDNPAYKLFLGT